MEVEDRLTEIIKRFKEKGFERQAVLLEDDDCSFDYILALTNPFWEAEMKQRLGIGLYQMLLAEKAEVDEQISKSGGKTTIPMFSEKPRTVELTPLEVTVATEFTEDILHKAAEATATIHDLAATIRFAIYREVERKTKGNDDLLYRIGKDVDLFEDLVQQDESEIMSTYHSKLKNRVDRLARLQGLSAPEIVIINEAKMLIDMIDPEFKRYENPKILNQKLDQDREQLEAAFSGQELEQKITELQTSFSESLGLDLLSIQSVTNKIFLDTELLKKKAMEWFNYNNQLESKRERVIKHVKEKIKLFADGSREAFTHDAEDTIFNRESISTFLNEESVAYKIGNEINALYNISLAIRKKFIEYAEIELKNYQNVLVGLQQIIAGGIVTNQKADPVSMRQNHNLFPNISYSKKVMVKLKEYEQKLRDELNNLPDFFDLAATTKMRKQKVHTYLAEELDKNPLDVEFGNDSGCCIFVPKDPKEMVNGFTVPYYQIDKRIRLFGIYHTRSERKDRMGLVPTFDTYREAAKRRDSLILACNSLELSRFGIGGGLHTINQLTDYVEEWIIEYAKQYGYIGAVMGSHNYNTSANFSKRKQSIVEEPLFFAGLRSPFYSDIFTHNEQTKEVYTRKGSCYWLWKK